MKIKSLILLELNEVNFDIAKKYADKLELKNISKLFLLGMIKTKSENNYDLLEPWIQWVSVHTGLSYSEHGVFRLGDIVKTNIPQIFELVESRGYSVGAICPMNAANRTSNPKYFIPDPWTNTGANDSMFSKALQIALNQVVNENAIGRIRLKSFLIILFGLIRFARFSNYGLYIKLALTSPGAPWRKALFLDLFLHDLHIKLFNRYQPHFSVLFLNAGAHIQHHYLFNSPFSGRTDNPNPPWYISKKIDPVAEMISFYDYILADLFKLKDTSILIATGLTQAPCSRATYYYRLTNPKLFLNTIGLNFEKILPRMSRDFEVQFASVASAEDAKIVLEKLRFHGQDIPIFEVASSGGNCLFVTLAYPFEIENNLALDINLDYPIIFSKHIAFVAIKNGMHSPNGFACGIGDITNYLPNDDCNVKSLFKTVLDFFPVRS